ncbi:hypothetical protein S83_008648, partial [Arachis hypogaea]
MTTEIVSSFPLPLVHYFNSRKWRFYIYDYTLILFNCWFVSKRALHQNGLHDIIPNEITNCTELRA